VRRIGVTLKVRRASDVFPKATHFGVDDYVVIDEAGRVIGPIWADGSTVVTCWRWAVQALGVSGSATSRENALRDLAAVVTNNERRPAPKDQPA
jgi:hypothetical protein